MRGAQKDLLLVNEKLGVFAGRILVVVGAPKVGRQQHRVGLGIQQVVVGRVAANLTVDWR
jgi:hypothetical protein